MINYPAGSVHTTQRSLRVIDSLQLNTDFYVAVAVNRVCGNDEIVPALSSDETREQFPAGWNTIKPSMRMKRQPSMDY